MDILGKLSRCIHGNQYVIIMTETHSKLIGAVTNKNASATHSTKVFLDHWSISFGIPSFALTDDGCNLSTISSRPHVNTQEFKKWYGTHSFRTNTLRWKDTLWNFSVTEMLHRWRLKRLEIPCAATHICLKNTHTSKDEHVLPKFGSRPPTAETIDIFRTDSAPKAGSLPPTNACNTPSFSFYAP